MIEEPRGWPVPQNLYRRITNHTPPHPRSTYRWFCGVTDKPTPFIMQIYKPPHHVYFDYHDP